MGNTSTKAKIENTIEQYQAAVSEARNLYVALRDKPIEGSTYRFFDYLEHFIQIKRYEILDVIFYEHIEPHYILFIKKNLGVSSLKPKHFCKEPEMETIAATERIGEIYRLKSFAMIYKAILDNFDIITKQCVHYHTFLATIIPTRGGAMIYKKTTKKSKWVARGQKQNSYK